MPRGLCCREVLFLGEMATEEKVGGVGGDIEVNHDNIRSGLNGGKREKKTWTKFIRCEFCYRHSSGEGDIASNHITIIACGPDKKNPRDLSIPSQPTVLYRTSRISRLPFPRGFLLARPPRQPRTSEPSQSTSRVSSSSIHQSSSLNSHRLAMAQTHTIRPPNGKVLPTWDQFRRLHALSP